MGLCQNQTEPKGGLPTPGTCVCGGMKSGLRSKSPSGCHLRATIRAAPTCTGSGFNVPSRFPKPARVVDTAMILWPRWGHQDSGTEVTSPRAHSDRPAAASLPGHLLKPRCPPAQGCFEHIGHAIDSYTWGISWFGFAILMWTVRGGSPWAGRGAGVGWGTPTSLPPHPAPRDADSHVLLHHALRDERGGHLRTLVSSNLGLHGRLALPFLQSQSSFPGFQAPLTLGVSPKPPALCAWGLCP